MKRTISTLLYVHYDSYVIRYVNVPKETKDLMLITYLFSTYLRCFSPDPIRLRSEDL